MGISTGDILQIASYLLWTDGGLAQMIFNAAIGGVADTWDDADIVDDAADWVESMLAEFVATGSNTLDGSEVKVYVRDFVDDDWDEVGSTSIVWNPTDAADPLPRGIAGLVNAKTIDPDVSGKKYVPGFCEDAQDDGLWVAGVLVELSDFADLWTDLFTGAVSGGAWVPGVWSPTRGNFYLFSGAHTVPTECAYQRRRKRGVGV